MEAEILKYICANQGAVDTDDLMCNLFPGESTNEVLKNQEKFVLRTRNGQQKVVARTGLRTCRTRSCPGSCGALHLCKNFLFSGFCQFLQQGRVCRFSHDLKSSHNQQVLKEHELECLSRVELCILLLQNDFILLPNICHDYNNGAGEFGLCQKAFACDRVHICEMYVRQDCCCSKTHDFYAAQPLKSLRDKGVPDTLILSLRSVYANKVFLRTLWKGDGGGSASANGPKSEQKQCDRGRGRGGNRGQRGNRGSRGNGGKPPQQQWTSSLSDLFGTFDPFDLSNLERRQELNWFNSEFSAAGADSDAKSESSMNVDQKQWYRGRGRGGNRGNRGNRGNQGNRGRRKSVGNPPQQQQIPSLFDDLSDFEYLDLYTEDGKDLNPAVDDFSTVGDDSDASSTCSSRSRRRARNPTSAARGRGGKQGGGQRCPKTRSANDTPAAAAGKNGRRGDEPNRNQRQKDKTEICMYFIKGFCKHDERCFKAHEKIPYKWEVREGDQWTALPGNETIEKDYCAPGQTSSGCPPVDFDTMTRGPDRVRRLSTVNSLVEPDFIHTTEWLWYWQDDGGGWHLYGADSGGHRSSDMNSSTLERKFLDNEKDVVEFSAGSQTYSLSFQDMIQTNKRYGTKRVVSRRPRFVSYADAKKVRKPPSSAPLPDSWDKTQIPPTGFSKVAVQRTSGEFQKVEALFSSTLRGFDIIQIERIQNRALWEVFQWQKKQMKNNNGGVDVAEKQLFHGTDPKHVDAICSKNFDWRLCGTHGTAFGKGSYFARDAKYSNSYTGNTSVRNMFISRVLVGSYTKGAPDYVRPPSKDGGDINFYDSCVNDVADPSVFVVFDKLQIYPEYLLQYKAPDPLADTVSRAPVQKAKPRTNPVQSYQQSTVSVQSNWGAFYQPSTPAYQPSTPAYQPSTPAYQPSTPAYQPSTLASKPSTPAYQPSTLASKPSTPAYQPSTLASKPSTPAYQPSTPSYRSGISSYQSSKMAIPSPTPSFYQTTSRTQPTQSPSSSLPPKATAKNSDSCVIA